MAVPTSVPGLTPRRFRALLAALMLAQFMASLEVSIIATALPTIAGEFNAFESYAWVGTAYIVTSAIATPLLGKLSDLYGRRLIFQTTMVIFIVGSLLCGMSQSMGQLIAFRAVQGAGGGAIQALCFAILADVISPRERGRYIGLFTLAFVASSVLGPLVGGFIVDHTSWRWIFFINVPIALVAASITQFALKLPFRRRQAKLDFLGAALLSTTIATFMIGLEQGQRDWGAPQVTYLFVGTAVSLALFLLVEQRAEEPLLPLRLFRNDVVFHAVTIGLLVSVIGYGSGAFLPLYFQDSLFVSPTESGLRMLPQMAGVTLATFLVGRLVARTGKYKRYPMIGAVLTIGALLAMAQIDGGTTYLYLVLPLVVLGFGQASVYTCTSIASQNAVEFRDLGVTTSTVMMFRALGGSIGMGVFGTVLNATIRSEIPARLGVPADEAAQLIRLPKEIAKLPDASRRAVVDSLALGVSRIFWISVAVMAVTAVFTVLLPERPLRSQAGLSDHGDAPVAPAPVH